ncbi:hypothetical protein HYU23_02130 [Candidatus Woesearchaeota archaeon]|nr:hypothetical protein [Candidatus Woesearchaeota archaeon]
MNIEALDIGKNTKNKIFHKHSVEIIEIKQTIFYDDPIYFKSGNNKYMCIGKYNRHITVILKKIGKRARIVTAYPSSKWQVRLYRRKK